LSQVWDRFYVAEDAYQLALARQDYQGYYEMEAGTFASRRSPPAWCGQPWL
jgi:hypothetical protein